jgi:DNA-binding Lrp family transcriptional regulator
MVIGAERVKEMLAGAKRALASRLSHIFYTFALASVASMLLVAPPMAAAMLQNQAVDGDHSQLVDEGLVSLGDTAVSSFTPGSNASILLAPLYLRLPEPQLLNSSLRSSIYSCVQSNPGATFTEIRSQTGAAAGTVQHHLRVLERGGVLRRVRAGKFTRFYPATARATRLSPPEERIARALSDLGPTSQAALGRMLGMSRQLVHYHVEHLEARGVVTREGAASAAVIRLAVPLTPRSP